MADEKRRTDINGKRVQDHLTAAAEVTPDSEAAAWLGVLYLYSLDRAGSEEGVPVWFKESAMVELLTASLDEETASGDAAYVMGHLCSDGLAGVAPSLEQAKAYYTLGAKQEHLGCVAEALLRGAALEGMLNEALHDRMLRFTESDSDNAALQIQDAYALAALTHSFEGEEQAPARRERAREFLQQNVELGLRKGLKVDRDFDRLTLYLATVMTPLDGQTELTESQRESVRAWVLSQKEELCDEIFGDGIPPRSLRIWAHLLVLDPALAAEVADARNDEGDVARGVQAADFLRTKMIPEMTAEDYADSPFIWSKAEAAQAALANR